jgi:hypothetical protein
MTGIHDMNTNIVHARLYKVDGVCYADEVAISQAQFDELADHYYSIVDALARPWRERDMCYDSTGRYNEGGQSAYEDRI